MVRVMKKWSKIQHRWCKHETCKMINWGAPIASEYDEHAKIANKKKHGKTRSKPTSWKRYEIQIEEVTKKCHDTVPKALDTGFNPTTIKCSMTKCKQSRWFIYLLMWKKVSFTPLYTFAKNKWTDYRDEICIQLIAR